MSHAFGVLLILLSLVVFIAAIVGVISPKRLRPKNSEAIPKRLPIALAGVAVPLVLFALGGALLDPEPVTPTPAMDVSKAGTQIEAAVAPAPAPAPARKNLSMTPEEFRKAYNNMVGKIDKSWRVAEFDVQPGEVNDAFNASLGKAVHIVGGVDKANGKLLDLLFVISSGQQEENMKAIVAMLSAAQVTTQGASKESITNTVTNLLGKAMDSLDKKDAKVEKAIVGNREYTFKASRTTGLMFSISDASEIK